MDQIYQLLTCVTESLANGTQQDSQTNESEGSAEEPAPGADDDGT